MIAEKEEFEENLEGEAVTVATLPEVQAIQAPVQQSGPGGWGPPDINIQG